jgi:hypothetical protein
VSCACGVWIYIFHIYIALFYSFLLIHIKRKFCVLLFLPTYTMLNHHLSYKLKNKCYCIYKILTTIILQVGVRKYLQLNVDQRASSTAHPDEPESLVCNLVWRPSGCLYYFCLTTPKVPYLEFSTSDWSNLYGVRKLTKIL